MNPDDLEFKHQVMPVVDTTNTVTSSEQNDPSEVFVDGPDYKGQVNYHPAEPEVKRYGKPLAKSQDGQPSSGPSSSFDHDRDPSSDSTLRPESEAVNQECNNILDAKRLIKQNIIPLPPGGAFDEPDRALPAGATDNAASSSQSSSSEEREVDSTLSLGNVNSAISAHLVDENEQLRMTQMARQFDNAVQAEVVDEEAQRKKRVKYFVITTVVMLAVVSGIIAGLSVGLRKEDENPSSCPNLKIGDLECVTSDGLNCTKVARPSCSENILSAELEFRFVPKSCNDSSHRQGRKANCTETEPFEQFSQPVVRCATPDCTDEATCCGGSESLAVEPAPVANQKFIVSLETDGLVNNNRGTAKIECSVNGDQGVRQNISIDTSGVADLRPGDTFGSFDLLRCDDFSCLESVTFQLELQNSGQDELQVTKFEISSSHDSASDALSIVLNPGMSTTLNQTLEVDTCPGGDEVVTAFVEWNAAGESCRSEAQLLVLMSDPPPPPPPSPPLPAVASLTTSADDCDISASVECFIGGDNCFRGLPCSQFSISGGIGIPNENYCFPPPTDLEFYFFGGSCESSFVPDDYDLKFRCTDHGDESILEEWDSAYIVVSGIEDNTAEVYFNGTLTWGDTFLVRDPSGTFGERIAEAIRIELFASTNQSQLLQQIDYSGSCLLTPFALLSKVGAVQMYRRSFFQDPFAGLGQTTEIRIPVHFSSDNMNFTNSDYWHDWWPSVSVEYLDVDRFYLEVAESTVWSEGNEAMVIYHGLISPYWFYHGLWLNVSIKGVGMDGQACTGNGTVFVEL